MYKLPYTCLCEIKIKHCKNLSSIIETIITAFHTTIRRRRDLPNKKKVRFQFVLFRFLAYSYIHVLGFKLKYETFIRIAIHPFPDIHS